jgi:cell division septation protein DedD
VRRERTARRPGARRGFLAVAVAVALIAGAVPPPVGGQVLERVDSLAREGRVQAARARLLRWFDVEADRADRDAMQRALWLRGILTLDPRQAEVDFTRLALEYPGGAFSDQALLRLARAARARGDLAGAARYYRRLSRDHPNSPARLEARGWLDRNAVEIAAAEVSPARPRVPAAGTPTPTPAGAGVPAGRPDSAAAGDGPFTVQIGAFADVTGARDLVDRLAGAGIAARLATLDGSDLIRVRAGRFEAAGQATRFYDRVVEAGFEAMVVADAEREVPYL